MFAILLIVLLLGAFLHARVGGSGARSRAGGDVDGRGSGVGFGDGDGGSTEPFGRLLGRRILLWLLVGYCGVPMVAVSVGVLAAPERAAAILGLPAGNPFQVFLGWAYLGMSLTAVLAVRYRGTYLVAPAVCWAVFLGGATLVHLGPASPDDVGHGAMLEVLAAHALPAAILLVALGASGTWRLDRARGVVAGPGEHSKEAPGGV